MISSPEGQFIDERLYPLLTRYLNYNEDSTLNYHQSYERGDEKKFNLQICQIENQFDSLNELLLQLNNKNIWINDLNELKRILEL